MLAIYVGSSVEQVRLLVLFSALAFIYGYSAWLLLAAVWRRVFNKPAPACARLSKWLGRGVLVLAAGGILCGVYSFFEPYWPKVQTHTIATPKLPPGSSPIRIVHISDTHCEPFVRLEERLPGIIADLKPDLIVFTGDASNNPEGVPTFRRLISDLAAIAPTYACRGNWDWRSDAGSKLYIGTGATELVNRGTLINVRGSRVYLAGMPATLTPYSGIAFRKAPADCPTVLLAHYPDHIEDMAGRVDVYLAGHTHGGQVALPFYGAILTFTRHDKKYESGLYHVGQTWLHISRGIGMEGKVPGVRFCSRPDVSLIVLIPQAAD